MHSATVERISEIKTVVAGRTELQFSRISPPLSRRHQYSISRYTNQNEREYKTILMISIVLQYHTARRKQSKKNPARSMLCRQNEIRIRAKRESCESKEEPHRDCIIFSLYAGRARLLQFVFANSFPMVEPTLTISHSSHAASERVDQKQTFVTRLKAKPVSD